MDHYKVVERALMHIEDHLEQPLSVESVATALHMSKFYFHRLFSAVMGCSLKQYILARRLNASVQFMHNRSRSLTEIAYQLNFGTQASFTRAFKRQYGMAPSSLRTANRTIAPAPVPEVVRRPVKNLNGDVVADFTLTELKTMKVSGIAFEVDLATDDYRSKIRSHANLLIEHLGDAINGPCYMIYSDCEPNSTRFKALFGVPQDVQLDLPYFFTVEVPELFCAKFQYFGDLLDIADVLKTDYARFLKISKLRTGNSHIELIQAFHDLHDPESPFHIYAPIQKLPIDSEW